LNICSKLRLLSRMTPRAKRLNTALLGGAVFTMVSAALAVVLWGSDVQPARPVATGLQAGLSSQSRGATSSAACGECHKIELAAWEKSHHAHANLEAAAIKDAAFWSGLKELQLKSEEVPMVVGYRPLMQPLVAGKDGRWQAHTQAYDPERKDWIDVFADETRRHGEWGHWQSRAMTWNSMCAHCHMTGFSKGYNADSDTYSSTWKAQGIGCIECHGELEPAHAKSVLMDGSSASRRVPMETCARCHARAEPLAEPSPLRIGSRFLDSYRPALPTESPAFYADGQQREEVFTWTSFQASAMGHAGVSFMDCHDPHSSETVLPVQNNALCLQCHGPAGRPLANGTRAPVIHPTEHSHHAEDSAGNQCVECHMPATTYLQRAPRRDHGFLKPDPLLTKELGIPNACSRCHSDKPIEWVIEAAEHWYGSRLDSQQRARTRAVAAAQSGAAGSELQLLAALENEKTPFWRAGLLDLLSQASVLPERAQQVAEEKLLTSDPLERAAAVRVLARDPSNAERLRRMANDPVRLVRLAVAEVLGETPSQQVREDMQGYEAAMLDQPSGRLRRAQNLMKRGEMTDAEKELRIALGWDANIAAAHEALGFVLSATTRNEEAVRHFTRAAELEPQNADTVLNAALALAENGRLAEAERLLRRGTTLKSRGVDRLWYNLGLLLAQQERLMESAEAIDRAQNERGDVADYPYALATVYQRLGDTKRARAAVERALKVDPAHGPARELLQELL
jgi:predicted CXXCH cytochrome family protein